MSYRAEFFCIRRHLGLTIRLQCELDRDLTSYREMQNEYEPLSPQSFQQTDVTQRSGGIPAAPQLHCPV